MPAFSRHLYCAVGGDWHWRDRLTWSHQRWLAYLDRPEVQTWVMYLEGAPAGYIELEQQAQTDVEIAYFGLIPEFTGRGLGGHLLSVGIDKAWAMGAAVSRVWVHTCTLDGPHALSNYQARGLRLYREEQKAQAVADQAEGPWPGAYAPESTRE